uniref:CARD domain-containing protein n=1 Tax=Neogobius melanostomus TaxID=47308 RepID=A0A8C6WI89_9GOBI
CFESRRILIADALEDLTPKDLSKFTARLKEPRGDEHKPARFRQGQLNGKDHQGLADLLTDSFSGNAVSITVALLRAIGANRVAEELGESWQPDGPSHTVYLLATKHFVDRNRNELIYRVSNVVPILDHLLQEKVLKDEQYDEAMKKSTAQDKMRFLFSGPLKSAGDRAKDELLSALKKYEPYLIKDLERKG